jgi:hypothetical protein
MRSVVSETSGGLVVEESWSGLTAGSFSDLVLFGPGPGAARLLVWELEKE